MEDPGGVWKSLNWINVPQVKRIANRDDSLALRFHTDTLVWMLGRALSDPAFASRRSKWMILAVRALRATGLLRLAALVPAELQPIMDVRLTKRSVAEMTVGGDRGTDGSVVAGGHAGIEEVRAARLDRQLEQIQREDIVRALKQTRCSKTKPAELLGVTFSNTVQNFALRDTSFRGVLTERSRARLAGSTPST
jgi:hypothetical protein